MDNKPESNLSKYLITIPVDQATFDTVSSTLKSTEMLQTRREMIDAACQSILEQEYHCNTAIVSIKRERSSVTIEWRITEPDRNALDFAVNATMYEIDFIPNRAGFRGGAVVSTKGNGNIRLELEEGFAYYCNFIFMDIIEYNKQNYSRDLISNIELQFAIPLSDERKSLLRKAVLLRDSPEERLRHDLRSFRNNQDAYDDMLRKGIEEIKSKGLNPDAERDQIEDFEDYAKSIKGKFNI